MTSSFAGAAAAETLVVRSPWLGDVVWEPRCELFFPFGLPGFEAERRMIPVEIPAQRPLVYLQSLKHEAVCFLCLPVLVIDPTFELNLSGDEKTALLLEAGSEPRMGADILCLGLLVPSGATVKANLGAPIVISLHNSRGIQCVAAGQSRREVHLGENGQWEGLCL